MMRKLYKKNYLGDKLLNIFKVSDLNRVISGKLKQGTLNTQVHSISIDSRTLRPGDLFFALKGPHYDAHQFVLEAMDKGAIGIVVCKHSNTSGFIKGSNRKKIVIEVEDTLKALTDWAKFLISKLKTYNICITGSSGKTTTKELVSSILSLKYNLLKSTGNYNNEIGIPLTLFNLKDYHEILIVEMGMRGLGVIRYLTEIVKPDLAVITNIGDSHIGLLGSSENICKAKSEILTALNAKGIAVLNRDDSFFPKLRKLVDDKKVITFGIHNDCDIQASNIQFNGIKGMKFRLNINQKDIEELTIPFLGVHNVYNSLAAVAVSYALGVDSHLIIKGLTNFENIKMHMQLIQFFDGIKILDDTYNANPSSVETALFSFQQISNKHRKILVLGDMLELGKMSDYFHRKIGKKIAHSSFNYLFTLGEGGRIIAQSALESGMKDAFVFSFPKEDIENLSQKISDILKPNDFILIKGSRDMKMEKINSFLYKNYKRYKMEKKND